MSQHGRQGAQYQKGVDREQIELEVLHKIATDHNGGDALGNVSQVNPDCDPGSGHPPDVGGADIAAAKCSDVTDAIEPGYNQTKWNSPQQIGDDNSDYGQHSGIYLQMIPPKAPVRARPTPAKGIQYVLISTSALFLPGIGHRFLEKAVSLNRGRQQFFQFGEVFNHGIEHHSHFG